MPSTMPAGKNKNVRRLSVLESPACPDHEYRLDGDELRSLDRIASTRLGDAEVSELPHRP